MSKNLQKTSRLLRRKEVESITGRSCSSIYGDIASGKFPKPVTVGDKHSVRWVEAEVVEWVESQIKRSRQTA
jgi:prophage regulatory protein